MKLTDAIIDQAAQDLIPSLNRIAARDFTENPRTCASRECPRPATTTRAVAVLTKGTYKPVHVPVCSQHSEKP